MAVFVHVGLPAWVVVLVSSALFGLAHSYQGRGGMVMTLLIGIILGISRIVYRSVLPAIFWHSAVDVVAGTGGPRKPNAERAGGSGKGEMVDPKQRSDIMVKKDTSPP